MRGSSSKEDTDSINDIFLWVNMFNTAQWADIPASCHGTHGALADAAGHAESKKRSDASIAQGRCQRWAIAKGSPTSGNTGSGIGAV
jgi:hypothetical protein